jgi:hypothetical protein
MSQQELITGEAVLYESNVHRIRVTNRRVIHECQDTEGAVLQSVALNQVGMCELKKTTRPLYLLAAIVFGIVGGGLLTQISVPEIVAPLMFFAAPVCVASYFKTRHTALTIRAGGGKISVAIGFRGGRAEFISIIRAIHWAQASTSDAPALATRNPLRAV